MTRALPLLLLLLPVPVLAQPAAPARQNVPAVPQPVLLDWGGQFRLNAPPNNAAEAGLDEAAAAKARPGVVGQSASSSRTEAALGPETPQAHPASRRFAPDDSMLTLEAPVRAGPVSLGASYGKYRSVPTTREISAHDARVSLGIAF